MIQGSKIKHCLFGERPIAAEDVSMLHNFVITDYRRTRLPGYGFREDRFDGPDAALMMAGCQRWVVKDVRGGVRRQSNL